MNQNWYKAADGKLYTTGLAETTIKPGEEKEAASDRAGSGEPFRSCGLSG